MAGGTGLSVDGDTLATLKTLALMGAVDAEVKLASGDLAARLDVSDQTAAERLQQLARNGAVDLEAVSDGQLITLTDVGERHLRIEYEAYRHIFEGEAAIRLTGTVTSGMGEGKDYISLPGYMTQFREKLGYEPHPGTLNLDLDDANVRRRGHLSLVEPVVIDGWEDGDRSYGPAYCYPVRIETGDEQRYEPAHIITPERTHHSEAQLELIAPDRLRDELGLAEGDEVVVHVGE